MKMPKFIKIVIFFLVLNLLFITKVQAVASDNSELQWTDFSKAKVYLEKVDNSDDEIGYLKEYILKIDNVSFATDYKTEYFVFLSNSDEKPDFGSTYTEILDNSTAVWDCDYDKEIDSETITPFIDKVGDIHVWIVEVKLAKDYTDDEYYDEDEEIECEFKEVLSNVVVSKPPLSSLGERISVSFEISYKSSRTSVVVYEPIDYDRSMYIELGKVNDYNLLYEFKNNDPNNLEHLIDYKETVTPVYKETVNVSDALDILSEVNLEDDAYYYTYVKLLDENGTYRSIEDISLYQSNDVEPKYYNDYVAREDVRFLNYKSPNFTWKLPSVPIQPTPGQDSGTNPGQTPGTNPSQDPSTDPGQTPDITPDKDPSTDPEQTPGTTPDQDPSTNPEQTPGTTPDQDPSTDPGQTPGITPDKDPSTDSGQTSNPGSNSTPQQGGSGQGSNNEVDNTVIQGDLPQTGEMPSILSLIILVALVGVVSYTCYIKYKDKV